MSDESAQNQLSLAAKQDPRVRSACYKYSLVLDTLRAVAPAELEELIFQLDVTVGEYLAAHLFTGFEIGRREVAP